MLTWRLRGGVKDRQVHAQDFVEDEPGENQQRAHERQPGVTALPHILQEAGRLRVLGLAVPFRRRLGHIVTQFAHPGDHVVAGDLAYDAQLLGGETQLTLLDTIQPIDSLFQGADAVGAVHPPDLKCVFLVRRHQGTTRHARPAQRFPQCRRRVGHRDPRCRRPGNRG